MTQYEHNLISLPKWLTCGPPMRNIPLGSRWYTVLSSKYLAGITGLTTLSIRFCRISARVMWGLCWTEITTVCTRIGSMAPMLSRYSTVTYQLRYSSWFTRKMQNAKCKNFFLLSYLWFTVRQYPWALSISGQFFHLIIELMGQKYCQWHALLCLIRRVAKHQALEWKS